MHKTAALFVVFLAALTLFPDASAHVMPNRKINLVDPDGEVGGWVAIQQNGIHGLRIIVALKHVERNAAYTVWILSCSGPPGDHPCPLGPLTFTEPFGARSPPSCPFSAGGGPLVTLRTNPAGNANSGAIRLNLAGVPPGQYFSHIDARPNPCHPAGALPPDAYTTASGFSFRI